MSFLKIGCVSQKGGVGKSTVARLLATEYARSGWQVLIADMDVKQSTATKWAAMRKATGIEPDVDAMPFNRVNKLPDGYQLTIFDGPPHSSKLTLDIAKICDLVIIPTGVSNDDLNPSVLLGHELRAAGCSNFRYVFCRVGGEGEERDARDYLRQAGYQALEGSLVERISYRNAQNMGKSVAETTATTLNERAFELAASIIGEMEE